MTKKFLRKKERLDCSFSLYDLDGPANDVITRIKELQAAFPSHSIEFEIDDWGGENAHLIVYGIRDETEEERKQRLANSRARKKAAEERKKQEERDEIDQLKDLLEKHGDKLKEFLK